MHVDQNISAQWNSAKSQYMNSVKFRRIAIEMHVDHNIWTQWNSAELQYIYIYELNEIQANRNWNARGPQYMN